VNLCDYNLIF